MAVAFRVDCASIVPPELATIPARPPVPLPAKSTELPTLPPTPLLDKVAAPVKVRVPFSATTRADPPCASPALNPWKSVA